MMKKLFLILLCCSALCLVTHSAKADLINYDYSLAADNTLTTSYSWATVDTFDSDRPGWTYDGYGKIRSGSATNRYAAPFNNSIMSAPDAKNYFAVPENLATGTTADVSFGGNSYNYLGLFWGSVDTYNKIEFYMDESLVASYTGSDVLSPNPANGNQSCAIH